MVTSENEQTDPSPEEPIAAEVVESAEDAAEDAVPVATKVADNPWFRRRGTLGVVGLLAAALTPLAYAVFRIPFGHRYMNFAIFLLSLMAVMEFARYLLEAVKPGRAAVLCLSAVLLLVAEVAPFGPSYFAFRPIWAPYTLADADEPQPGRLNPTWLGWGENAALVARELQRELRSDEAPAPTARLFVAYYAPCLADTDPVRVLRWPRRACDFSYADSDYYLLNRSRCVQGFAFPHGAHPDRVIRYRGLAIAWVFRGDRLRADGIDLAARPPRKPTAAKDAPLQATRAQPTRTRR